MIDETLRAEIRRLVLGERWAINTVARHFGVHHSVVRRAIKDGADKPRRPVEVPTLEPYKPYIVERLLKYPELTARWRAERKSPSSSRNLP